MVQQLGNTYARLPILHLIRSQTFDTLNVDHCWCRYVDRRSNLPCFVTREHGRCVLFPAPLGIINGQRCHHCFPQPSPYETAVSGLLLIQYGCWSCRVSFVRANKSVLWYWPRRSRGLPVWAWQLDRTDKIPY